MVWTIGRPHPHLLVKRMLHRVTCCSLFRLSYPSLFCLLQELGCWNLRLNSLCRTSFSDQINSFLLCLFAVKIHNFRILEFVIWEKVFPNTSRTLTKYTCSCWPSVLSVFPNTSRTNIPVVVNLLYFHVTILPQPTKPPSMVACYNRLRQGIRGAGTYPTMGQQRPHPGHTHRPPPDHRSNLQQWQ